MYIHLHFYLCSDFETPTVVPARSRSLEFKVVDRVDDAAAFEITEAPIGRIYYLRICYDRGTVYTRNILLPHIVGCWVRVCAGHIS